jgi:hypothetical protein
MVFSDSTNYDACINTELILRCLNSYTAIRILYVRHRGNIVLRSELTIHRREGVKVWMCSRYRGQWESRLTFLFSGSMGRAGAVRIFLLLFFCFLFCFADQGHHIFTRSHAGIATPPYQLECRKRPKIKYEVLVLIFMKFDIM